MLAPLMAVCCLTVGFYLTHMSSEITKEEGPWSSLSYACFMIGGASIVVGCIATGVYIYPF